MTGHENSISTEDTTHSATRKHKRSRKGCLHCLQSKVKCNENHPVCDRCNRTGRQCAWPGPHQSLRARRRGNGPYKDRPSQLLRPIIPTANSPGLHGISSGGSLQVLEIDSLEVADIFGQSAEKDPGFDDTGTSSLGSAIEAIVQTGGEFQDHQLLNTWMLSQCTQMPSVPYSLSTAHIPSSSSIIIKQPEWEALQFFEHVFAKVYSPKPFPWSNLGIVAQFGKSHGGIQHLIVAACLGQLTETADSDYLWRLGKQHYQAGAQLVMQDTCEAKSDHCKIFISFWLLQITYNTYWSDKAANKLKRLSQAMAQYTRKHFLIDQFTRSFTSEKTQEMGTTAQGRQSLLARTIIFSLYEDIDADFCHAGGFFAAELCADKAAITSVYLASKNCLTDYFGADYPHDELIDDIQRSNVLDLHFEANLALNTINQASRGNRSRQSFEVIANRLETLKLQYSSTFRLTQVCGYEGTKLVSSAHNVVAHFLAVETYNFRCLQAMPEGLLLTTRLHCTTEYLLATIGKLCREWPKNMPYRNQWLYFITGVGTSDSIHIAWIADKLKKGRYYGTLQRVLAIQRCTKRKMGIEDIRSLFWGLEDEIWQADGDMYSS